MKGPLTCRQKSSTQNFPVREERGGKKTLAEEDEDEDVSWKTREGGGRFFPTDGLGGREGGP